MTCVVAVLQLSCMACDFCPMSLSAVHSNTNRSFHWIYILAETTPILVYAKIHEIWDVLVFATIKIINTV